MNRASPEMMNFQNNDSGDNGMSVLERQRARLRPNSTPHQPVAYFSESERFDRALLMGSKFDHDLGELFVGGAMKSEPGLEYGWSDLSYGDGTEYGINQSAPRTASCPPALPVAAAAAASKGKEASTVSVTGRENLKKRKTLKAVAGEKSQEKKMKACADEESKITDQNSNCKSTITAANSNTNKGTSADNSKENSKVSEAPKQDYIHVRARRGQATDSHSLAERARREKISERMKYLQDLVPGCYKITGKAGMLDEIINYVQSLQRQVEFLSMKLAAINPAPDFEAGNYITKEMFPACAPTIPTLGSDMVIPSYLQFNGRGQGVPCDLEMGSNPPDVTLRRTISAPVSIPDTLFESSCLNQIHPLAWDAGLQNLYSMEYQQGRSASFIPQPVTGFLQAGHLKQEM